MNAALSFELVCPPDICALEHLWRTLEASAPHSFFQSWNWVGTWLAELDRPACALIGRAPDGRVVLLGALSPSLRRNRLPVSTHGLHLHSTGDDALDVITTEYNGFLVDAAWQGQAETQAIRHLFALPEVAGHRRNELHLRGIAAPFAPGLAAAGLAGTALERQPSWYVDLASLRAAGGDYLAGLSANTRYQIRRSMRLFAADGPLVAEPARSTEEALAFLDALKTLHQRYWTSRGEPGAFAFPFFERFQRRLIETCQPGGQVELVRIRAGQRELGYLYNFRHNGRVLAYQSGFHYAADPRLKPGLVSHTLCIERHLREGAAVYDFLAGAARYKASLGRPGPDMTYWLIERPTRVLRAESRVRVLLGRSRAHAEG